MSRRRAQERLLKIKGLPVLFPSGTPVALTEKQQTVGKKFRAELAGVLRLVG
jgi:hypothetical protein